METRQTFMSDKYRNIKMKTHIFEKYTNKEMIEMQVPYAYLIK